MYFFKLCRRKSIKIGTYIFCFILFICFVYKYFVLDHILISKITKSKSEILRVTSFEEHNLAVRQYFGMRKNWRTSNIGSLIFKHENKTFLKQNKTFVVFVWNYWDAFQTRHVLRYRRAKRGWKSVFSDCTVNNCVFTGDNSTLDTADVILIHVKSGLLPTVKDRNPRQIWVFLNDEPPPRAFYTAAPPPKLKSWANVFNWSMTYRSTSDVPVPYGRTVPFKEPLRNNVTYKYVEKLIPNFEIKRSDVLVTIILSNCRQPFRMTILEELQKHIKVDVYGNCSKTNKDKCPGYLNLDCAVLDHYYFYLVIQNSICRQYLSEKIFFNAYSKGAIPILVGPLLQDCKTLLPPNSYIHYEDYQSYHALAERITGIIQNTREYLSYHIWRNHFRVSNEHGFFGTKSYHLCRLCEALNYNEQKEKVLSFENLRLFLDPRKLCIKYEPEAVLV